MTASQTIGYAYIWEYRVNADDVEAFRTLYGPTGAWVRLFQRAPGYLFTELHQDRENPRRFVTIDHWRDKSDLESCRREFAAEWSRIDQAGEALTESELHLGEFDFVASSG